MREHILGMDFTTQPIQQNQHLAYIYSSSQRKKKLQKTIAETKAIKTDIIKRDKKGRQ